MSEYTDVTDRKTAETFSEIQFKYQYRGIQKAIKQNVFRTLVMKS